MIFQFTIGQINQLRSLRPDLAGSWTTAKARQTYDWLTVWTSTSAARTAPLANVDRAVWTWLRGARLVNQGPTVTASSRLIRAFTNEQNRIRKGALLTDATLQRASDEIIRRVANDIANPERNKNRNLLTLDVIAGRDAEGVRVTGLGLNAWSGNLLFLALGHSASFQRNLVDDITQRSDTYSLLAATAAFRTAYRAALGTGVRGFAAALGETVRETGAGQFLANTTVINTAIRDANTAIQRVYGDAFTWGSAFQPLDSLFWQNLVLGTESDDARLQTRNGVNDVAHGGAGNDTLYGSSGVDLLDGGLGRDTIHWGNVAEALTINVGNRPDLPRHVASAVRSTQLTAALVSNMYNVEEIIGTRAWDRFQIRSFRQGLVMDGNSSGTGVDCDVVSGMFYGRALTFNMPYNVVQDPVSGLSMTMRNIEVIEGTIYNDVMVGRKEIGTVIYGGAGHDYIVGGDGTDYIHGGTGFDYMDGGAGNDTYILGAGDNNDTVVDGSGRDTIWYSGDIREDQVRFLRENNDLLVDFNGGALTRFTGHYAGTTLEEIWLTGINKRIDVLERTGVIAQAQRMATQLADGITGFAPAAPAPVSAPANSNTLDGMVLAVA